MDKSNQVGKTVAVTESENFKQLEEKLRSLRPYDKDKELDNKNIQERVDREFVEEWYEGLRREIDRINTNPDNDKYLNEFSKAKIAYENRGLNLLDLLKDGLKSLNFKANTGRAKQQVEKKREGVNYDDTDIDSKGVYLMLHKLGFVDQPEKTDAKATYLEGQETAAEGLSINEASVKTDIGIEYAGKNRREILKTLGTGDNPFKGMILTINNNLHSSNGPTSTTRMVYEMLQRLGVFDEMSEEEQDHRDRFVYFIDMAYFLKQRIYGMDYPYISGTMFGNYKYLTIEEIYKYLEEHELNTGFEFINGLSKNESIEVSKKIRKNGQAEYIKKVLAETLEERTAKVKQAGEDIHRIEANRLKLKIKGNPTFLFDINEGVRNAEDVAIVAAGYKLGFAKIHPNNEIFIRSFYYLPKKIGPFVTESSNTIHGKLTEENLQEFLDLFEGDKELKERIPVRFQRNKKKADTQELPGMSIEDIKIGEEYDGVINSIKDFGAFVQITRNILDKRGHFKKEGISGLVHLSNLPKDIEKGDKVRVKISNKTEKGISLEMISVEGTIVVTEKKRLQEARAKLPKTADVKIEKGMHFKGVISGKAEYGVFVQVAKDENSDKGPSGLLHSKGLGEKEFKNLEIGQEIDVVVNSVLTEGKDAGKINFITKAGADVETAKQKLDKALAELPKTADLKIEKGMPLKGVIYNIKEGVGALIQVATDENSDKGPGGLLHIRRIGGDDVLKQLEIGQKIDVIVGSIIQEGDNAGRINFKTKRTEISQKPAAKKTLSPEQKKLQEALNKLPKTEDLKITKGITLKGVIDGKTTFGVFVTVAVGKDRKGLGGLLHIGQIGGDEALKKLEVGQEIDVKVDSIIEEGKNAGRLKFGMAPNNTGAKVEKKKIIENAKNESELPTDIKVGAEFEGTLKFLGKQFLINLNGHDKIFGVLETKGMDATAIKKLQFKVNKPIKVVVSSIEKDKIFVKTVVPKEEKIATNTDTKGKEKLKEVFTGKLKISEKDDHSSLKEGTQLHGTLQIKDEKLTVIVGKYPNLSMGDLIETDKPFESFKGKGDRAITMTIKKIEGNEITVEIKEGF